MAGSVVFLPTFFSINPPEAPIIISGKELREKAWRILSSQVGTAPSGTGTPRDPFKVSTPEHWIYCARNPLKEHNSWYKIGNRIIRRRKVNNYIEDWGSETELNTLIKSNADAAGNEAERIFKENTKIPINKRESAEELRKTNEKGRAKYLISPGEDNIRAHNAFKETSYQSIAISISTLPNDGGKAVSQEMRNLLSGKAATIDGGAISLATGAMFIAETARNPLSFLMGLVLLDLIESQATYGKNKKYTWSNILWDPTLVENPVLDEEKAKVAGKWPMAHTDSYNETKEYIEHTTWREIIPVSTNSKDSTASKKEASLLVKWFWSCVSQKKFTPSANKEAILIGFEELVKERIRTFDLKLLPPVNYPELNIIK
ncbi:hypothetical protein PSCICF_19560 [Pseudomonas cichorii]|nr:hypothetical protein [Pseudomonas cichorii]GFM55778.1 hypothetical protein PSCICF_19560 [Pseudomonas cichorii]